MEERESEAVSKPGGRTPPRARMSGGRPRPRACLLVGPSGRAREFNGRHTTKSDACKSEAWERVEAEGEREEPFVSEMSEEGEGVIAGDSVRCGGGGGGGEGKETD